MPSKAWTTTQKVKKNVVHEHLSWCYTTLKHGGRKKILGWWQKSYTKVMFCIVIVSFSLRMHVTKMLETLWANNFLVSMLLPHCDLVHMKTIRKNNCPTQGHMKAAYAHLSLAKERNLWPYLTNCPFEEEFSSTFGPIFCGLGQW